MGFGMDISGGETGDGVLFHRRHLTALSDVGSSDSGMDCDERKLFLAPGARRLFSPWDGADVSRTENLCVYVDPV